ncbi:MAG: glycosyltransferase [marine benthic group bacterium]|nr:glycosyltransferase [Gemmatimonadota bacterium]MCL7975013.1 glycosyltransferase [Gemmatimonadota bacterium]
MKRALFVAFHFAPENVSGTHRSLHFARCLADRGFDVTVLTRSLSSLTSLDTSLEDVFPWPDRIVRVAPGDTRLDRFVDWLRPPAGGSLAAGSDGEREDRAATADDSAVARRAAGNSSSRRFGKLRGFVDWALRFPDEHKGWYEPALVAGRRILDGDPFDVVFASGPPWTGIRVGAALAREGGIPFLADYRDPWTRRSGRTWKVGGPLFDLLGAHLEDRVIRDAAMVIANSPGITDGIRSGYPALTDSRLETIVNGSNARRRDSSTRFPGSAPIHARHFGSLYAKRKIGPLLAAALRRNEEGKRWTVEQYGPDPGTAYLGALPAGGRELLERFEPLPFHDAVQRMHEPGLLVMIQPALLSRQVPTKLFDYLCTGNPVLLLASEESSAWTIARRFDRCFRADPDDVEGIVRILADLEDRRSAGELMQVSTVDDTRRLTKESIGLEFTSSVERVLLRSPSP